MGRWPLGDVAQAGLSSEGDRYRGSSGSGDAQRLWAAPGLRQLRI
jgi:hypothetical protein